MSSNGVIYFFAFLLTIYVVSMAVFLLSHSGMPFQDQHKEKRELEKERKEVSAKTAMWVGVDSMPEFEDLLNLTFNWMYAAKVKLEEQGLSPDLVDPTLKDLPQLNQLLAVKRYGGSWSSGITLREYLGMSSADFKKAYEQFNAAQEAKNRPEYMSYMGGIFLSFMFLVYGIHLRLSLGTSTGKQRIQ